MPKVERLSSKRIISFTIPIAPQAWQRVKRGRYGQAYVPDKTRNFEMDVMWHAKKFRPYPRMLGALKLTVDFYISAPKRKVREFPSVRPDLDNYVKALKDALNLMIWLDDAQVVESHERKLYDWAGKGPRIEVTVEEVE